MLEQIKEIFPIVIPFFTPIIQFATLCYVIKTYDHNTNISSSEHAIDLLEKILQTEQKMEDPIHANIWKSITDPKHKSITKEEIIIFRNLLQEYFGYLSFLANHLINSKINEKNKNLLYQIKHLFKKEDNAFYSKQEYKKKNLMQDLYDKIGVVEEKCRNKRAPIDLEERYQSIFLCYEKFFLTETKKASFFIKNFKILITLVWCVYLILCVCYLKSLKF